jgi:uncharacterized membrane protein YeaQ/YmgE (transglycosylase-associated protein family)
MSLGDILVTLIVGGIVGWVAGLIMKTGGQMGVLMDIIVGIVGSALGGWVFGLLGFAAIGLAAHLITAIGGAVLLIALLKGFRILR